MILICLTVKKIELLLVEFIYIALSQRKVKVESASDSLIERPNEGYSAKLHLAFSEAVKADVLNVLSGQEAPRGDSSIITAAV